MVSKRTLTQILFVASLGVSASVAALSPRAANAEETCDCGAAKMAKADLTGAAKAALIKFNGECKKANVTTVKGARALMKSWKPKAIGAKGANGKDLGNCKTCHIKQDGGELNGDGYNLLAELLKVNGL